MKITKKILGSIVTTGVMALSYAGIASAHVVVKPSDAKTGAFETFSVGVPTERKDATIRVRLLIPKNMTYVTPTVKPGWTIQTDKSGEGEDAVVSAITWSGGEIKAGYRDDFTFTAKTPDQPTDVKWKAYQTYQDGTVVSWDQDTTPTGAEDEEGQTSGALSVTKVMTDSDQDKAIKSLSTEAEGAQSAANWALWVSIGAAVVAIVGVVVGSRKTDKIA